MSVIDRLNQRANAVRNKNEQELNQSAGQTPENIEAIRNFSEFSNSLLGTSPDDIISKASDHKDQGDVALDLQKNTYTRRDDYVDHLANFGAETLNAGLRIAGDAVKLISDADTAADIDKVVGFDSRTREHEELTALHNERMDEAAAVLDKMVMNGELTEFQKEVTLGKQFYSNLNRGQLIQLGGSVTGSVVPMVVAGIYGGPAALATVMGVTGMATLNEGVDQIRGELFKKDIMGNFEYTHNDLMQSSPIYNEIFNELGDENAARLELDRQLKLDHITDPAVLGVTVAEMVGDYLLLKMGGVLKAGKTTSTKVGKAVGAAAEGAVKANKGILGRALGAQVKGGLTEAGFETVGSVTRTIKSNETIKEHIDDKRSILEGSGRAAGESILGGAMSPGSVAGSSIIASTPKVVGAVIGSKKGANTPKNTVNIEDTEAVSQFTTQTAEDLKNSKATVDEAVAAAQEAAQNETETQEYNEVGAAVSRVTEFASEADSNYKYSAESESLIDRDESPLTNLITLVRTLAVNTRSNTLSDEEVNNIYTDVVNISNQISDDSSRVGGFLDSVDPTVAAQFNTISKIVSDFNAMTPIHEAAERVKNNLKNTTAEVNGQGQLTDKGAQTVRQKLSVAPETLTENEINTALQNFELEMFEPEEVDKLSQLRQILYAQRQADQIRADQGINTPLDVVNREIMSDEGKGRKGLSVARHALDIMSKMRNNNLSGAKSQMAVFKRFIDSHTNKLNALREGMTEGKESVEYDTYAMGSTKPFKGKAQINAGTSKLAGTVEAELAFMQTAYNGLIDALGSSLAKPIENTIMEDIPVKQESKSKESEGFKRRDSKITVKHTAESVSKLSDTELQELTTFNEKPEDRKAAALANRELQKRKELAEEYKQFENESDEQLLKRYRGYALKTTMDEQSFKRMGAIKRELDRRKVDTPTIQDIKNSEATTQDTKKDNEGDRKKSNTAPQQERVTTPEPTEVAEEIVHTPPQSSLVPNDSDLNPGTPTPTGLDPSNQFADLDPTKTSDIRNAVRTYLRGSKDFFDSVELSDFLKTVDPTLLKDELSTLIDTVSRGADPDYIQDLKNRIDTDPIGSINEMSEILSERGKQRTLFDGQGQPTTPATSQVTQTPAVVPTTPEVAPEAATETPAPTKPLTPKQQLLKNIKDAIEAGGDNVKTIMYRKKDRTYVELDGVVYNEKGGVIVDKTITNHFAEAKDPDAVDPAVVQEEEANLTDALETDNQQNDTSKAETKSEESEKAAQLKSRISLGNYVSFAANKTAIFVKDAFADLIKKAKGINKKHSVAYADALVASNAYVRNQVANMKGILDTALNNVVINTVAVDGKTPTSSKIAMRKALYERIKHVVGEMTDDQFKGWVAEHFPKTDAKGDGLKEVIRQQRAKLVDLLGGDKELAALAYRDMAAKMPKYRAMEMFAFDPKTDKFAMPAEVVNAVSIAVVDFLGNFNDNSSTFYDVDDFTKAFGITDKLELKGLDGKWGDVDPQRIVNTGLMTEEQAVNTITRKIVEVLGVTPNRKYGEGLTKGPIQGLAQGILENLLDPNSGLGDFVGLFKTEMNNYEQNDRDAHTANNAEALKKKMPTRPISRKAKVIYIPVSDKFKGSRYNDLSRAKDYGIKEMVYEPERTRYIDQVPTARTKDKHGNNLSVKQKKALEAQVSVPFKLNKKMFDLYTKTMGFEGLVKLLGDFNIIDPTNGAVYNEHHRESLEGKNLQLLTAMEELQSLYDEIQDSGKDPFDTDIFYNAFVSSVGRIMMDGGFNPQGDKVIRSVVTAHEAEIDASTFMDYLNKGGEPTRENKFLTLAYAQAFGVKIHNMTLDEARQKLNSMFTKDFKNLAKQWHLATFKPEAVNMDELIDKTKSLLGSDANELAVQTLVELGDLQTVDSKDLKGFKTHAYIESDGVTNGPFVAGYLLGIDVTDPDWIRFMENSGLYIGRLTQGKEERSKKLKNNEEIDNYTGVAQLANILLKDLFDTMMAATNVRNGGERANIQEVTKAMQTVWKHAFGHITVNKAGDIEFTRNSAKNPVTVIFYGSSKKGIANKFSKELADYIYSMSSILANYSTEEAANLIIDDPALDSQAKVAKLNELMRAIDLISNQSVKVSVSSFGVFVNLNGLPNVTGKKSLDVGRDSDFYKNYTISKKDLEVMSTNLENSITTALHEALEARASSTLEGTKIVGRATNAHSILATTLISKHINELMASSEYDHIEGLTPKQTKDIKDKMKSYGLSGVVADQLFSLIKTSSENAAEHTVGNILKGGVRQYGSGTKMLDNLGVSGIPRLVQAMGDVASVLNILLGMNSLPTNQVVQVYDGINYAYTNFEEGGQLANDAYMEAMKPDILKNLYNQLESSMAPMLSALFEGKVNTKVRAVEDLKHVAYSLQYDLTIEDANAFVESVVRAITGIEYSIENPKEADIVKLDKWFKDNENGFTIIPKYFDSVADAQLEINRLMLEGSTEYINLFRSIKDNNLTFSSDTLESFLNRKNSQIPIFAETGLNAFSLKDLKVLRDKVDDNFAALNQVSTTIEQMAGVGTPAHNEQTDLTSTVPEEIAVEMKQILKKVKEDKKSEFKTDPALPNNAITEKQLGIKDNSAIAKDNIRGFLQRIAGVFKKDTSSDDPRIGLLKGLAHILPSFMEKNGLQIKYDTNSGLNQYDPSTGVVTFSKINPSLIIHELIHGVTANTIHDYYNGNRKNLSISTQKAIENLELLMHEVMGSDQATYSPVWQAAIQHMKAAGQARRLVGDHHLVVADQMNELLAIFTSDPVLLQEAKKMKVKSLLNRFSTAAINTIKSILGFAGSQENLLDALATNLMVIANEHNVQDAKWKNQANKVSDSTPSVPLQIFESTDRTGRLNEELNDAFLAKLRNDRDTIESVTTYGDVLKSDPAQEFKTAGFNLNDNEQKAVNQLAATIAAGLTLDPQALKDIYRYGAHIMRNIKPEDFGDTSKPNTPAYFTAMNKFNSVTGSAVKDKKAMIPALIALAIVNKDMGDIVNKLGIQTGEQSTERKSAFEKSLGQFGYDAIDVIVKTKDEKTGKIASVLQQWSNSVKKPNGEGNGLLPSPVNAVEKANEKLVEVLEGFSTSLQGLGKKIHKVDSRASKALGNTLSVVGKLLTVEGAKENAESLLSALNKSDALPELKNFIRDFIGRTESNASVYDMIKMVRSFVQRTRQMYVEGIPNIIRNRFNEELSAEDSNKLFYSMATTDLAAIAEYHGTDKAIDLLSDDKALNTRIEELAKFIGSSDRGVAVLSKAKQLARYMNTGITGSNLLINATAVARLYGEPEAGRSTPAMIKAVDEYVSLIAFKDSDNKTFKNLSSKEREGIKYILSTQKGIRTEELQKTDDGLPAGIKGYIPTKPSGTLKIAPMNQKAELEALGYKYVSEYKRVAGDPMTGKLGYFLSDVSYVRPFSQGIIQNTLETSNGLEVNTNMPTGDTLLPTYLKQEQLVNFSEHLKANSKNGFVGIYDSEGNLINVLRSVDQEIVLKRRGLSNIENSLGVWRGRQVEEEVAHTFNEAIIDNLQDSYESSINKDEFVDILDKNLYKNDPVLRDALNIISPSARQYADSKYGKLMVNRGMLSNVVGYRQASITNIWDGNTRINPEILRVFKQTAEAILGPKAYYYAIKADDLIAGLVGDAKQLIVVKSVVVPVINILSNLLHMAARGAIGQMKGIPKKVAEVEEYSKTTKRLIEIESDILAAEGNPAEIRKLNAEKVSIYEYQKKLSIWPLIEAGEFTSIVSTQIDNESAGITKGKIAEHVENTLDKTKGGYKTLAKNLFLTRDTALYQFLQKSVDYGDFVAKAAMYDHWTKTKGMSHEKAIGMVREEFVNYDTLPGRIRGGLERMGLLWFYNYKVRSVKVAAAIMRENPLTALMTSFIPTNTPFGNIDDPTTANFVYQLMNGKLGHTIGPGMGLRAPFLHPLVNIVD